ILPVISRKGSPNIKGIGKLRYVVEQTFALLHHFKRLVVRWERRTELTTPSSPSPAASSAGDDSRRPDHDRVTSSKLTTRVVHYETISPLPLIDVPRQHG
ncbi:hypothetical protein ACLQ2M_22950, partial [Streptomyces sp. DT7]